MPLTDLQVRELCLRDYYFFVRYMNKCPEGVAPVSEYIHAELCDFYSDPEIYRGCITMPRAWMKSTIFTKWGPIWRYLHDNEERILIAAENEKLAGRFLQWMELQLLSNKRLRRVFPELQAVDRAYTKANPWSKSECLLPREGLYSEPTFTAIGVGGAAQSGHYTTIHIDDLVGKKAAESPLVLETVQTWVDNVNELLVQPEPSMPGASRIWIIGTFWFPGDFLCYVHEKYPDYQFRVTPCQKCGSDDIKDEPNLKYVQDPTVGVGESNWGDQFPTSYYVEMAANPEKELVYWAQHMNMPHKSSMFTKFDLSWFRFWHFEDDPDAIEVEDDGQIIVLENPEGGVVDRIPDRAVGWRGMLDPGGFAEHTKLTKGDSRTAILVGGQPIGKLHKIVRYAWADRFKDPDKMMDQLFHAHKVCRPLVWRQEIFGQQKYILKDIKLESKARGVPLTIVPFDHDTKKDAKDHAILGLVQPAFNGEIYIHRSMKALMAEIQMYPNSVTKDLIDMLAQLNKMYWARGTKVDVSELNRRNLAPSRVTGLSMGY